MKRLILAGLLFASSLFGQSFDLIRGDRDSLTFTTTVDYSGYKLHFAVKEDRELTSSKLFEKKNTLRGGSDAEILATASTIMVYIAKENTQAFTLNSYYYDLVATGASDTTIYKTLNHGRINMVFDVNSPYDGATLSDAANTYLPILATDYDANTFIKSDGNDWVEGTQISDAAYGAGWNGDDTTGASKNAIWDKVETIAGVAGQPFDTVRINQALDGYAFSTYGYDDRDTSYYKTHIDNNGNTHHVTNVSATEVWLSGASIPVAHRTSTYFGLYDNMYFNYGSDNDFGWLFNGTNLNLGDGTNTFLTVTDQGTTADFAFTGSATISDDLTVGDTATVTNAVHVASSVKIEDTDSSYIQINQQADNVGFQINGYDDVGDDYIKFYLASTGQSYITSSNDLYLSADNTMVFRINSLGTRITDNKYMGFGSGGDFQLLYDETTTDKFLMNDANANTLVTWKDMGTTVRQDINGKLTVDTLDATVLSVFPVTPSEAPDADYEVANKKYVDDNAGSAWSGWTDTTDTRYFVHSASHGFSVGSGVIFDSTGTWNASNCSTRTEGIGRLGLVKSPNYIQVAGEIYDDSFSLTPGRMYYISSSNGAFSTTPPTVTGYINIIAAQSLNDSTFLLNAELGYGVVD